MNPVFTLPYSEHEVAEGLARLLPKNEGYSITVPVSAQNKGWDLLVYNQNSRSAVTIQVKASKSYDHEDKPYAHYLWFNRIGKGKPEFPTGAADFYALFGLYPHPRENGGNVASKRYWSKIILLFTDEEMKA